MSRLSRVQSSKSNKKKLVYVLLSILLLWFLITSGLPFLINSSVFLGNLFGGNRGEFDYGDAPEFYNIEFDDVPDATNSASIRLSGYAENLDRVTVVLNGNKQKPVSVKGDGEFSTTVDNLKSGNNEIYVEGKNSERAKTEKSEVLLVVYDSIKPALEITEPADGNKTPRDEIVLKGKTNSEPGLSIRVQGLVTTADPNGNFESSVRLKEGENTITVTISDPAGNTTEKSIKVYFEK